MTKQEKQIRKKNSTMIQLAIKVPIDTTGSSGAGRPYTVVQMKTRKFGCYTHISTSH